MTYDLCPGQRRLAGATSTRSLLKLAGEVTLLCKGLLLCSPLILQVGAEDAGPAQEEESDDKDNDQYRLPPQQGQSR